MLRLDLLESSEGNFSLRRVDLKQRDPGNIWHFVASGKSMVDGVLSISRTLVLESFKFLRSSVSTSCSLRDTFNYGSVILLVKANFGAAAVVLKQPFCSVLGLTNLQLPPSVCLPLPPRDVT